MAAAAPAVISAASGVLLRTNKEEYLEHHQQQHQQQDPNSPPPNPPGLDSAITEIKNAIQVTSSRPGFNQIRGNLFGGGPLTSEEEVQIIGGGDVTEAEISHLKESIVHIKKLVLKTSQQFNLQHQDILKRAVEKHKGEQARVMACNKQIKSLLAAPLQNQLNPHHQQQQQQQVQPQMLQHPQQPQPVILASAAPPGLIQISAAGPLPQVPSPVIASPTSVLMPRLPTVPVARLPASQQPVQPPRQATSADEQRMLRYGKAILKLKHYRRALKYAMWDFQDGKSMEEAAAQHKITIDVLKYSVDLILQKTGETLDQFRQNKALNLEEHPGPKSEDYISRLQRAVNYFKQKSGHSLYEFASANQISLFDLTDELIKELEIENKISSLKPVTLPPPPPPPAPAPPSPLAPPSVIVVSQHQHHQQQHQQQQQPTPQPSLPLTISLPTTPVAPSALTPTPEQQRPLPTLPNIPNPVPTEPTVSLPTQPLPPPGTSAGSSSSSVFSDSDATTILSDIDELIRDDTAELSHVTISTCPQTGDLIANNNNDNEVQAVISVNICNVCKKLFLDPKAFQEHESAGCIDF